MLKVTFLLALCSTVAYAIVPLSDFFAYGPTNGDSILARGDDTSSVAQNLSIAFPFFDQLYSQLWVNVNGAVSFRSPISTFTPSCQPVSRDFSMVSPFWADVDTRDNGRNDAIYFRESREDADLQKAQSEVYAHFPNVYGIQLKWVYIVTWYNVTYYSAPNHPDSQRNTFQAAITTNGVVSFVIFYYNDITWTTGDASDGHGGLGGIPAQAGFDAGDGLNRLMMDGSCTGDMLTVQQRSNVNSPGKWAFRVDLSGIQSAGCTSNFSTSDVLRISPSFVTVLGHVPITVTGPCIKSPNATATCRFRDPLSGTSYTESEGTIDGVLDSSKIICDVPFLFTTGRMQVDLIISDDNGTTTTNSTYSGYLYVTELSQDGNGLHISVNKTASNNPDTAVFTWDPKLFSNGTTTLSLQTIIFDFSNQLKPVVKKAVKLAENIDNNGLYLLKKLDSAFNLIGCNPEDLIKQVTVQVITDGRDFTEHNYGINWAANAGIEASEFIGEFCGKLVREAACGYFSTFSSGVAPNSQPCPPTQSQAEADLRFAPEYAREVTFYHPGEDICYQSVVPSADNGGQECCYKRGNIDCGVHGGHSEKYHPSRWFLHYVNDILPWVACCYDASDESCQIYQTRRPSDCGAGYTPPAPALGTGDPHVTTFDGFFYTFNGRGEFWLLKNTSDQPLAVQARMEFLDDTVLNATVFSAFAFLVQGAPKLQVQKSAIRTVDIYIDDQQLDITSPSALKRLSMEGWQMTIADDLASIHIAFDLGFAFEISTVSGAFGFSAAASAVWKSTTHGLLGTFNNNPNDDLTSANGTVLPANASLSDIHYNFGLTWMTTVSDSIFTYFNGKTYNNYNFPEYSPSFDFNPEMVSNETKALCQDDWACLFDYHFTGDSGIANQTLLSNEAYQDTVASLNKTTPMCPALAAPENGYVTVPNYFENSTAIFGCFTNYTVNSDITYTCSGQLSWQPSNYTLVKCIEDVPDITATTPTVPSPSTPSKASRDLSFGFGMALTMIALFVVTF